MLLFIPLLALLLPAPAKAGGPAYVPPNPLIQINISGCDRFKNLPLLKEIYSHIAAFNTARVGVNTNRAILDEKNEQYGVVGGTQVGETVQVIKGASAAAEKAVEASYFPACRLDILLPKARQAMSAVGEPSGANQGKCHDQLAKAASEIHNYADFKRFGCLKDNKGK